MSLQGILQFTILVLGAFAAAPFFYIGVRLMRANHADYEINRRRSGNLGRVLFGEVSQFHNGERDAGVGAAVTIERRRKKDGSTYKVWLRNGRLTRESISTVLD